MNPGGDLPPGAIVITAQQMYEEVKATRDEVKHLTSVLEPTLNELRKEISESKDEISSTRSALHTVEQRVWFHSGAAAALGTIGGFILSTVTG